MSYTMELEFTEVGPELFRLLVGVRRPESCPFADRHDEQRRCACGFERLGRRVRW
jgi:hypothetical protein